MDIDKRMLKKIQAYDRNLFVEWDHNFERFAIKRRADDGSLHHIFFVNNPDGSFRPLDERVLEELYECDLWKHFKDGQDFHRFIQEHNNKISLQAKNLRKEYLEWYRKEHRKEFREALENAQKGIF